MTCRILNLKSWHADAWPSGLLEKTSSTTRTTSSNLLSKFGLTLLNGGNHHVTDTGSGQTIQSATDTEDGDNVQVLGSGVVSTVHDSANWQSQRHLEFVTRASTSSS